MATQYTAKIPFSRLVKIGIWSNQSTKYAMSTIYSKLKTKYPGKEIYIINGGFFNMSTFRAIFDLKADGTTYSKQFTMAYMGMKDNKIKFDYGEKNSSQYTDIVTAYPILIEKGVKSPNFEKLDGAERGRSMLGYNDNEVIVSCIQDVSNTSDFSMNEELNFMLSQKCTYAINLDGGGSSQCNFNGKIINSSRKVNNFVYLVATPATNESNTTPSNAQYPIGSIVKLKKGAKWISGKTVPDWVMNSTLYVRAVNGNNITISTQKTGAVTGTVLSSYIEGNVSSSSSYQVKITAQTLNVRSTYSTSGKIVGKVTKNQIVTIVEVKNNWGKLGDNSGWIYLQYTKKVN